MSQLGGTNERRRSWDSKRLDEVGQRFATLLTRDCTRHATCNKAKPDLKKPSASPTSATGYGTSIRIA